MENPTRIAEPAVLLANDYPCLLPIVCAVYRDMPEKYEHLNSIVFAVTHYGRDLPQFTKQAYAVTWQQMRSNAERFQDYIANEFKFLTPYSQMLMVRKLDGIFKTNMDLIAEHASANIECSRPICACWMLNQNDDDDINIPLDAVQAVSHVYNIIYATRPAPQKRRRQENKDDDSESSFPDPIEDFHQFENTVQATPLKSFLTSTETPATIIYDARNTSIPETPINQNAQRSLSFSF